MVPQNWEECISTYDNARINALAEWNEKSKKASSKAAKFTFLKRIALRGFQMVPFAGESAEEFHQRFIQELEAWGADYAHRMDVLKVQTEIFEQGVLRMFSPEPKDVKVKHHYLQREFARGFAGDDSKIFASVRSDATAGGILWTAPLNAGEDLKGFGLEKHLYDVPSLGSYRAMWEEWFCEVEDATAEVRRLFTQPDWAGELTRDQEVLLALYLAVQSIRSPYAKAEAEGIALTPGHDLNSLAGGSQHAIRGALAVTSFRLLQELLSSKWIFCRAMEGSRFISGDDPGSVFFAHRKPMAWIPLSKRWCLTVFRDPIPALQAGLPAGRRSYRPMLPPEVLQTNATVAHFDAPRFIIGSSEQLLKDAQGYQGTLLY